MSFYYEKNRCHPGLGTWGSQQLPSPFQSVSVRSKSLWKQWKRERGVKTVGYTKRNRRTEKVRETRHKKLVDSETDKRNRWATEGQARVERESVPWEGCAVLQQSSTHWVSQLVHTLNHCCPAPGGSGGTRRLSCHRVHITGLAARDTAALWRHGPMTGLSAGGEKQDLSSRRARDDTHWENCWCFNLRSQMLEVLWPW